MKLKTRLIIGFIIVMILPLTLSLAVIAAFGQFQIRSIERNYGITGADFSIITNPINALSQVTEPTVQQLLITAKITALKTSPSATRSSTGKLSVMLKLPARSAMAKPT